MELTQAQQYALVIFGAYLLISAVLFFTKAKTTKTVTREGDYGDKYTHDADLDDKVGAGCLTLFWPFQLTISIVRAVLWRVLK